MKIKTSLGSMFSVAMAGFLLLTPWAQADGRIKKRAENQQDRIAQGIKSGQLTAREAANLERKEARLNHEVRDMREDNGGKLTPAEKAKINRQQNRLSRDIYREKHDSERQPH